MSTEELAAINARLLAIEGSILRLTDRLSGCQAAAAATRALRGQRAVWIATGASVLSAGAAVFALMR